MSNTNFVTPPNSFKAQNAAFSLSLEQRKDLAVQAIAKTVSITQLAQDTETSRKFIYAQKEKAQLALDSAFSDQQQDQEKVLFYLPVTPSWLIQLVIALILICRSSYQGVSELLQDLFNTSISKGHIHDIVYRMLDRALKINREQDLSQVRVGAHDEIFQAGRPVLVGCDAESTYCYLLSEEERRDATTWGVRLLDLRQHQNLKPKHTVADAGTGLRKGQIEAWPDVPYHGDVFHALQPLLELATYLDHRALETVAVSYAIQKRLSRPRRFSERDLYKALGKKLMAAEKEMEKAIQLSDDARTLYQWLKDDILSLIGPPYTERQHLLSFIVEELKKRESLCSHKIYPVQTFLENNQDNLLQFARHIDKDLLSVAEEFKVSIDNVRMLYELQRVPFSNPARWQQERDLHHQMGKRFYGVESRVKKILDETVRASSVVENLNSRLRNYFTLRRHLGKEYLSILQFFLNHRRLMRSEKPERIGKSPRELMTGQTHPHWLELLGFKLFKQAA